MSIATDLKLWGGTTFRVNVTSTSSTLDTLTSGAIAATIAIQLAIVPTTSDVHLNIGAAASASTFKIPKSGVIFNCDVNFLEKLQLFAANTTAVDLFIGSQGSRMFLQDSGIIDGYDSSTGTILITDSAPNAAQFTQQIDWIDQLFDDNPNSALTFDFDLKGFERVGLHFYTDVTIVGAAPQVIYSFEMSYDNGTTFVNVDLMDTSDQGFDQASAAVTVDGELHFVSGASLPLGVLRVTVTPANTDSDDTVQVNADLFAKKG